MDLNQAQQSAWLQQPTPPETSREALGRLKEGIRLCLGAFEEGKVLLSQQQLENILADVLVAMHTFNLQAGPAFERALARRRQDRRRAFHVYADRVEIRVGPELRGTWPLTSQQEYEAALQLALELGCDVVHEEALQLPLFEHA